MSLKGYKEIPDAGLILNAPTSIQNKTGSWRSMKPIFHEENCINCLFCWWYCPDSAIIIEDGKMKGINYDYCKGCGICVHECPGKKGNKALELVPEKE